MSQKTDKIPDLDKLFALPSLLKAVKRILSGQPGIVAVTGQRGSGKSTTLYSLALEASRLGLPISIITDERQELAGSYMVPKEWRIHHFDGSKSPCSRAIDEVSENQPVAIVNDLTDDDFALRIGIDQASKGRWFFTVLDTPFIGIDVVYYLREGGLTSRQFLDSFVGIVSQILIPRLCRACAQKVRLDVEDARLIYPNADDLKEVWREAGCLICQNSDTGQKGTKGRCAALEVLLIDDEVRSILDRYLEKHTLGKLPSSKHIPLQTSIRELVKEGTVGIETYKWLVFQNPLLRAYNKIEALEVASREAKLRVQIAELRAQAIEKELQTAHDLQMGMMSHEKPQVEGFDIAGRCLPANHVGGDFFKYFALPGGRVGSVLADVTGHAMEAAVPMLMFSGVLESQVELGGTMEDLFSRLNRSLHRTLPGRTFVCLEMGELDPSSRRLRLSNSGCPYPYHFRAVSGEVAEIPMDAYPLGVRPDTEYPVIQTQLEAGDRVVFCSDGIAEAVNAAGEQFGYERTAKAIRGACEEGLSAEATIDRILSEVNAFRGNTPQADDMTCVVVRVEREKHEENEKRETASPLHL